jgi:membrane-associated phospholipid phosphatase
VFDEARPYATHPHLVVLASRTSDFSFPSDHAVMAGAVASGLLLVSRRLGLVAVAAAVLMAFSRVYIAAHYPWDVLAGLALGAAVALLGWLVLRRPLTALSAWLRHQPGVRSVFAEVPRPAAGVPGARTTTTEVRAGHSR